MVGAGGLLFNELESIVLWMVAKSISQGFLVGWCEMVFAIGQWCATEVDCAPRSDNPKARSGLRLMRAALRRLFVYRNQEESTGLRKGEPSSGASSSKLFPKRRHLRFLF